MSSNASKPNTTLCDPYFGVDRKYDAFAKKSVLSRPSGVQTPQKVSDHHRAPPARLLSMSSVPWIRSVDLAPDPMNWNVRFETSASTNRFELRVPLYVPEYKRSGSVRVPRLRRSI